MLNEKLEYSYYLSHDLREIPLRKEMVKEHLTGIRRPLQVLARGFLGKCSQTDLSPEKAAPACKAFLFTWMTGQLHESIASLSLPSLLQDEFQRAADNSFLRYANLVSSSDQSEQLLKKAQEAQQSPYSKKELFRENNFNRIFFDYIVADALYFGPLREYCLILKGTGFGKPYGLDGTDKERKIALAVVSQYLQIKSRIGVDPQREFVPIVQAEIGNWVNVRSKSGGKAKNGIAQSSVADAIANVKVAGSDEPLFQKLTLENNMKIRVSPLWLAQQEVQLIPETVDKDCMQQGFLVITDEEVSLTRHRK